MSDGDRSGINKTGLIAAIAGAAIFAGGLIGWGVYYQSHYEQTAYNQSAQHAEDAENHIRQACVPLPPQAEHECAREANNTRRQAQRDEYDLYSQRIMALWTLIMGAAAVFGVGLSSIGVYLIWQTFQATKTANEILRRQLKPSIKLHWGDFAITENEEWMPWTKAKVENLGHTTARRFKIRLSYRIETDDPIEGELTAHATCREFDVGDTQARFTAFGAVIPKDQRALIDSANRPFVKITGSYTYEHEFGREGPIPISLDGQIIGGNPDFRAHLNVAESEQKEA